MDELSLVVPDPVLDSLPDEDGGTVRDMRQAVDGYEERLDRLVDEADDEAEAAAEVLVVVEHFEARARRFDEFVPELRAWGQSPVYSLAWRGLYADLVEQLYGYDWLVDQLDRERDARLVEDWVRFLDG